MEYLLNGGSGNVGEACRALRTTPMTLLGKTLPGLERKIGLKEIKEKAGSNPA